MLEEEYERTRRRPPQHLRKPIAPERPFAYTIRPVEDRDIPDIREMVAIISDKGADASIALHEKLGFTEVGRMGRVGFKFGRWLGTIYLQKHLKPVKKRGFFGRILDA